MIISDIMDELGVALARVEGLRVFPYSVARITPPAAVVLWPETIRYDQTMGRGSDRVTLPVIILVGRTDDRSARDTLSVYLDGYGASSVKTVVEAHNTTRWDSATVTTATPDAFQSAGVEYIGAQFEIDIFGTGAA